MFPPALLASAMSPTALNGAVVNGNALKGAECISGAAAAPEARAAKRPRLEGFSEGGVAELARLELPGEVAGKLCAYLATLQDTAEPVIRLSSPEALRKVFREAGIALELLGPGAGAGPSSGQEPSSNDALVKAVELLLQYSVRTGSPLFFNQLYARADPAAIAADWVVAATNTNCFTYEVAPVFTLMEAEVMRKIAEVIGGEYARSHDGLFCPGGSISNLYAMHLAHHSADPDLATRGASGGPRCVAFVSDQCHYSFLKSARVIGLGSDNLISVGSDSRGRMIPEALEEAVLHAKSQGFKPFFVGATAGTTVLGAYDPFDKIDTICKRHGLWHHVDACWGGGALLSERHRHNMLGAEKADSLAWNPHKMSGACLQCSAFITRHVGLLAKTNSAKAAYLFQPDKLYSDLDVGDKTIQCGRKPDMFKLWLLWKAKGDVGMQRTVDHCFALAAFMAERLREASTSNGAWELVYEPSCSNVCFWYVPERMRPFKWESATQEQKDEIHKVAPLMKNEMQRRGDALIGFQAINGRPNFFRMVFAAADTVREEDIVLLLERMAAMGEDEVAKADAEARRSAA
mmetsp:Transcript_18208/g.50698  ORF Transcript_18208/g.50698 Transcript_18208/m.50698 type:complete len:576 (+) Transcript_18208:39-1766(+)